MNVYAIINGINALCALVIIGLILVRKPTKTVHLTALFWYACLFLWTSTYFFWGFQTTKDGSIFWLQALLYACCFIHLAYFHFTVAFCKQTKKYKNQIYLGYISSFAFFLEIYFLDSPIGPTHVAFLPFNSGPMHRLCYPF